ncbi:hypothetical protein, partial [Escherichia coli]|uniref:hypothetical protein n=1 Tax=Escherichia coli TaxID=562 RepID=UPI001BB473A3
FLRQVTNEKLPDALRLSGLLGELQNIELARSSRPDKAFTPHPARNAGQNMPFKYLSDSATESTQTG